MTYSSVVYRNSVQIALSIAALNNLDVLDCELQNAYFMMDCIEWVWVTSSPEFGSEDGNNMLVIKALYGLKSSGAAFMDFQIKTMYTMNESTSYAEPDIWLQP